jgi:hypothetical protein
MTSLSDDRVIDLLRRELRGADGEPPQADLWPRVQRRIQEGPRRRASRADWLLLVVVAAICALQPSAVVMLLFHF